MTYRLRTLAEIDDEIARVHARRAEQLDVLLGALANLDAAAQRTDVLLDERAEALDR